MFYLMEKNAIYLSVMERWTGTASSVAAQAHAGMIVFAAMRAYMNTSVSIWLLPVFFVLSLFVSCFSAISVSNLRNPVSFHSLFSV